MGVFTKSLLSSKYINAEIVDSSNQLHFVPIKNVLGGYFIANINGFDYCFKLDGTRYLWWQKTLTSRVLKVNYHISHYLPIDHNSNAMKLFLEKNNLPKIDNKFSNFLKVLAKNEKTDKNADFKPYTLENFIDEVNKLPTNMEKEKQELILNIKQMLENLSLEQIVTPVRPISEFIDTDLKATDPQFLGTIVKAVSAVDIEHKKITNTPISGKQGWIKILAVMFLVGLIIAIVYIAYDQGAFDFISSSLQGLGDFQFSTAPPPSSRMSTYSPEELKAMVDSGAIKEADLSPIERDLIKNVKPTVTPVP
jgi:hypothetical protein